MMRALNTKGNSVFISPNPTKISSDHDKLIAVITYTASSGCWKKLEALTCALMDGSSGNISRFKPIKTLASPTLKGSANIHSINIREAKTETGEEAMELFKSRYAFG